MPDPATPPVTLPDALAAIDGWRADGADRVDPVRFRVIEAMAARMARHDGAARRVLDQKLAQRMAAYSAALDASQATRADDNGGANRQSPSATASSPRSALAEVIAQLAQRDAADGDQTLAFLRTTWSRLSAERRLAQSLATVPGNAGPLNSHHLAHRALTVMREISPGYLSHFVAYVDALLWLDQATAPAPAARAASKRSAG